MLVLSRRKGERVVIGEDLQVTVLAIRGDRVKLGFAGPRQVPIYREELRDRQPAPSGDSDGTAAG